MSKTGKGQRASAQARDTPVKSPKPSSKPSAPKWVDLFDATIDLQLETHAMEGLGHALRLVIGDLTETAGIGCHPSVNAAEALVIQLQANLTTHSGHLQDLETGRFYWRHSGEKGGA